MRNVYLFTLFACVLLVSILSVLILWVLFSFVGVPGRQILLTAALGYFPERLEVTLPHRGELRGLEVQLVSFRLRILDEFRTAAAPRLESPAAFDLHTPREIADGGSAELVALAQLVEETSYSTRAAAPEDLARAATLRKRSLDRPERTP